MSTRHLKTLLIDDGGDYGLALRTKPVSQDPDLPAEPLEIVAFSGSVDDEDARTIALTREDAIEIVKMIDSVLLLGLSERDE